MTLIRFTDPDGTKAALDGIHVLDYAFGAETDAPQHLAEAFVERGIAEYVGDAPDPVLAPDAAPLPAQPVGTPAAEAAIAQAVADTTPVPLDDAAAAAAADGDESTQAETPDVIELPTLDASRKDIDAFGARYALDTTKLPSKQAALDAIGEAIEAAAKDTTAS